MAERPPGPQDAFVALEAYQRQLEVVGRQIELLQNAHDETARARMTLEGLGEEKSGEILIPVGTSTFVRGTVAERDHVITGIGAGYATERPRQKAIERFTERESSLKTELDRMMQTALQLQHEIARLQDLIEEAQQGQAA